MVRKKILRKRKAAALLLVFTFVTITSFVMTRLNDNLFNTQSKAEEENPYLFCLDKCAGWDRCDLNNPQPNDDPNYNAPCCKELEKTGDPSACDWPQRGYCTIDQCNAIPEGVSRERCGGPRQSWCNLCKANKCPGYVASVSPTSAPTLAVSPTSMPTVAPTSIILPTLIPTTTTVISLPTPSISNTVTLTLVPSETVAISPEEEINGPTPTDKPGIKLTIPDIFPYLTKLKNFLIDFAGSVLP